MPLSNLLTELFEDIDKPVILWQAGIILVCMVAGWLIARMMRRAGNGVVQVGVTHFSHVLTPSLIACLVFIAKLAAEPHLGNVKLLKVALPVFGSLAVIRMAFYLLRRSFARHGPLGNAIVTFEKVIALMVWACVALYLTGLWTDVFAFLETTKVPLGKGGVALSAILQAAVSVEIGRAHV